MEHRNILLNANSKLMLEVQEIFEKRILRDGDGVSLFEERSKI